MAFDLSVYWPLLGIIIFGALALGVWLNLISVGKENMKKVYTVSIIAGLVFAVAGYYTGAFGFISESLAKTKPLALAPEEAPELGPTEVTGMVSVPPDRIDVTTVVRNIYKPGNSTQPACNARVYVKNNGEWTFKEDSTAVDGTFTFSPGDVVRFYVCENQTDGQAGYYTRMYELTMPNKGTAQYEFDVYPAKNATITFYNEDGDKIVAGTTSTHQDIDAGDEISSIDMKISGSKDSAFSPDGPMICVFKYSESAYDSWEITSCEDREVEKTNVPGNVTSATGYKFSAYEISKGIYNTEEVVCDLFVDADGTTNPNADNVTVTCYDSDYGLNEDTGLIELDIEDPVDDGDWGTYQATGILYVSKD